MIKRYTTKEMNNIWSTQNRFQTYLNIEILTCEAWAKLGIIPPKDLEKIQKKATFNIEEIEKLELTLKHDIVAFTRNVSAKLGDEKKWIHYGLTSSDVVDTANGATIKQANDLILISLNNFVKLLKSKAIKYRSTVCIGRTHGIHADITSFGLKWALWYDEMRRNLKRFNFIRPNIEVGKLSGAVGNFANNDPFLQTYVCNKLNIHEANISTQVISRDVYAEYIATIALIGSTIEKIAIEIRNLQRTEVHEVEEFFQLGQKGSSAMPHKRNPIASENMCGCARMLRGYMQVAYENNALWHERDISHSSTERIILPDTTNLIHYMLNRYYDVLDKLIVYPKKMLSNIYLTHGVIFAQRAMNKLIANALITREQAYDLIQPIAMEAYDNNKDFKTLLLGNKKIRKHLREEDIESCFTTDYYLEKIPYIYKKLGIGS